MPSRKRVPKVPPCRAECVECDAWEVFGGRDAYRDALAFARDHVDETGHDEMSVWQVRIWLERR